MFKKVESPQTLEGFLAVFSGLYAVHQKCENAQDLRAILQGRHVLAREPSISAYYWEGKSRGMLIVYPGEKIGYLGFLEAVDEQAFAELLAYLERQAEGLERLVGPVDLSFWLGYRLRVADARQEAFVSEPWHLPFYESAFLRQEFYIAETYVSNYYSAESIGGGPPNSKSQGRYAEALAKGYVFRTEPWEKMLPQVYALIMETYKDFPLFRSLSLDDFRSVFSSLERAIDFSMIEGVYRDGQLHGFLLTLPDYGTLGDRALTLRSFFQFWQRKRKAKHYVLLYMAVRPGHEGLGLAMTYRQFEKIRARRASATAALIHQGKFTQFYEEKRISSQTRYYLFEKELAYTIKHE